MIDSGKGMFLLKRDLPTTQHHVVLYATPRGRVSLHEHFVHALDDSAADGANRVRVEDLGGAVEAGLEVAARDEDGVPRHVRIHAHDAGGVLVVDSQLLKQNRYFQIHVILAQSLSTCS